MKKSRKNVQLKFENWRKMCISFGIRLAGQKVYSMYTIEKNYYIIWEIAKVLHRSITGCLSFSMLSIYANSFVISPIFKVTNPNVYIHVCLYSVKHTYKDIWLITTSSSFVLGQSISQSIGSSENGCKGSTQTEQHISVCWLLSCIIGMWCVF